MPKKDKTTLQGKINNLIVTGMIYAAVAIVIGIVLVLFPKTSENVIRWVLAIALMAAGVSAIVADLSKGNISVASGTMLGGILALLMGIIVANYPSVLNIIPIVVGICVVLSGASNLRLSLAVKHFAQNKFIVALASALIQIVCGLVLIFSPNFGLDAIMVLVGVVLVIYAASALVDLIIFRTNFNNMVDYFKSRMKIIDLTPEPKGKEESK